MSFYCKDHKKVFLCFELMNEYTQYKQVLRDISFRLKVAFYIFILLVSVHFFFLLSIFYAFQIIISTCCSYNVWYDGNLHANPYIIIYSERPQ